MTDTTRFYRQDSANMLLGALFVKPELFDNPEAVALNEADFIDPMHKIAYSIMFNLFSIGHIKFSNGVISSYLVGRPHLSKFFNSEIEIGEEKVVRGDYYFSKLAELGDPSLFLPAFDMIKKMTLLRNLEKNGVSVNKYYDWDTTDQQIIAHQQSWLEQTDIKDIANQISEDISVLMNMSGGSASTESFQIADGLEELIETFKVAPEFGAPSPIAIMDTVTRGDRLGKFYLFSAPTGNGKSRIMMSRACYTGVSHIYDQKKREWIPTGGGGQPSLFISTELDKGECQTMALAFITGIDEEIILSGKLDKDETTIIKEAIRLMEESKFFIDIIPDFSIQELESTIRKYYREHEVSHFRFDYIHTSMKFLAEISSIAKGLKLREDQILFMLATRFKDLANQLGIFIESGTQVNGDYLEGELNQNVLRGAKSLADRLDVGIVATKIRPIDEEAVNRFVAAGLPRPNYIMSFYKVRRGKYAGTKLWCHVDLGTCRGEGLFLTDSNDQVLPIDKTTIKVVKAAEKRVAQSSIAKGQISAF